MNPNHVTLALNKPKRVLSAMEDPKGRYTLSDIVGDMYDRIFHMGRLDYDSEGLILMTNDGELSQHVMHPKYEVEKTYVATLRFLMPAATARWSRLCCIPARTVSSVAFSVRSDSRSSVWYAPRSARLSLAI